MSWSLERNYTNANTQLSIYLSAIVRSFVRSFGRSPCAGPRRTLLLLILLCFVVGAVWDFSLFTPTPRWFTCMLASYVCGLATVNGVTLLHSTQFTQTHVHISSFSMHIGEDEYVGMLLLYDAKCFAMHSPPLRLSLVSIFLFLIGL